MLVTLVLLAVGLAFAATPGLEPRLRTDSQIYSAGDTVKIELKAGPRTVGYNLCFAYLTLQRQSDFDWEDAPMRSHRNTACLSIQNLLQPFRRASGTLSLRPDLAPGLYRITHEIEVDGDRYLVASNTFTVL